MRQCRRRIREATRRNGRLVKGGADADEGADTHRKYTQPSSLHHASSKETILRAGARIPRSTPSSWHQSIERPPNGSERNQKNRRVFNHGRHGSARKMTERRLNRRRTPTEDSESLEEKPESSNVDEKGGESR